MHVRMHHDRIMACVHWPNCKEIHFFSIVVDVISPQTIVDKNSSALKFVVSAPPMQILYNNHMHVINVED